MWLLLWLLTTFSLGTQPYEEIPGRWYPDSYRASPSDDTERLEQLGYLDGYQPPEGASGVITWNRARSVPGMSLYTSGHAAEALLIHADGRIQHRWSKPFAQALPDVASRDPKSTGAWRRVAL